MHQKIRNLKNHTLVRYMLVGGTSFAIELTIIFSLIGVGHSRQIATGIAYWIGLLMAFALQKLIAFRDYRREFKVLTRQGAWFSGLMVWNWLFTVAVVSLFPASMVFVSRVLAQVIFSCWNYVIYKKIIFKQD